MHVVRYPRPRLMFVGRMYGGSWLPQLVVGEIVGELSGCQTIWVYLAKRSLFKRGLRWFGL